MGFLNINLLPILIPSKVTDFSDVTLLSPIFKMYFYLDILPFSYFAFCFQFFN